MKRLPLDADMFLRFFQTLDERHARLCAAERALAIGRGGITLVSRVTGLSYPTIHKGITELRNPAATLTPGWIRRPGKRSTRDLGRREKKRKLVGDFKNGGRTWQPTGHPIRVQVHDFPSLSIGKAVPHGIYDVALNRGFVNVGTSHDTPYFAVESIGLGWEQEGRTRYPLADALLVLADSGGSNGARSRLWKGRLQELADALQITITVCHLPPGTSKWNKIEHRLFAFISIHWRGRPLVDFETIVSLIGTTTGLTVTAQLDLDTYPTGVKIPGRSYGATRPAASRHHPQWNYSLAPRAA